MVILFEVGIDDDIELYVRDRCLCACPFSFYNKCMKPLLIAHRGDTENYPENTIGAFQSAFDRGAGGIEFDVHCHEGGEVVVVHDYTHDMSSDLSLPGGGIDQVLFKGKNGN